MSDQPVRVEKRDGVATVTIDRPERRNALSRATVQALREAFDGLSGDEEARVIVLTGAGDRAFSAGGDLGDQQPGDGVLAMHHGRGDFVELLLSMNRCARPIIARVNGQALGGGFGVMLNCDLAVATEEARFGTPEIKVGLFPMMIMAVIARNLGRKRTLEMMLTGARIDAATALDWGIVNRVVPAGRLDEATQELAQRVAGFSPAILQLGRQAFYKTQDMGFEEALRSLQNELTINTLAEDAAEGIMAFLGKREPEWKGR